MSYYQTFDGQRPPKYLLHMVYSKGQLFFLVLLRLFAGWHFFYEGLVKLINPAWTAQGYLQNTKGSLAAVYGWLGSEALIGIADALTIGALLFIGLSLLLGFLSRAGAWAGIGMLLFFYLAYPPLPGLAGDMPAEGSYFLIDKNLVELAALGVLAFFPTSHILGLKAFWRKPASARSTATA